MTAGEIIEKYIKFFEAKGHKQIQNSPLIPENDPTTLFTSSGMQPLVPYLLGEPHPAGTRLVNVQDSFRSQDIEEIGDNRHTTFFRMLGNWSLGDYFKKEQLNWFFEFLTQELKIDPKKLYVTCFEGYNEIPKDTEAEQIWKEIFQKAGMDPNGRIFFYGPDKNWWSRSGPPQNMPPGEPGGPDSEVFYDFGAELKIHENSKFKDNPCHPNCDCGRFFEIGNSVFMQYVKTKEGGFQELSQKNVDFGGGLERQLSAIYNEPDVFQTSLYKSAIEKIEEVTWEKYEEHQPQMRTIADHLKASIFMIISGVRPSNKEQGYVLRRLIRRSVVKFHELAEKYTPVEEFKQIVDELLRIEEQTEPDKVNFERDSEAVNQVVKEEVMRFGKSLDKGLKIIEKADTLTGKDAFDLYQTYGFPLELTIEIMDQKGKQVNVEEFKKEFEKHKELSRTSSAGMFKGGLADQSESTIMGHTATHLLHQALKDVLGEKVNQTGSNITNERVRFDFNYEQKLSDDNILKIEQIVNDKIKQNLKVEFKMMPLEEAKKIGAIGLFNEKYAENVKVYSIGAELGKPYSTEICGGPHVDFTGKLKSFKIIKQDNIGHGQRRIYAKIGE